MRVSIHHSGRASPGRSNSRRWRLTSRSSAVIVPSCSIPTGAGSSAVQPCAAASARCVARIDRPTSDRACASQLSAAGSSPKLISARTDPSRIACNSASPSSPGACAIARAPQKSAVPPSASASKPRCAARLSAMQPTSRAPMPFAAGSSANGPAPGRPIRPVATCRFSAPAATAASLPPNSDSARASPAHRS